TSSFFSLVCVNTLPSTTTTDEKPPDSLAFHNCRGPSLGHSVKRPVSREMPSRRGPRQRGQSSARARRPEHAMRNASASPIALPRRNDMVYLVLRRTGRDNGASLPGTPARNNWARGVASRIGRLRRLQRQAPSGNQRKVLVRGQEVGDELIVL